MLVLKLGMVLALIGAGIGLLGAFGLTRLISSQLFGVTPTDPATFGVVTVLLLLVAIGAMAVPTLRALRLDPLIALRDE